MHSVKTKKSIIAITIVVAIILIVFVVYSLKLRNAAVNSTIPSNVAEYTVSKNNIDVSVEGSGSVNPADKRTIKSEEDGTVNSIYVSEGDSIERDQVLVSLKSDSANDNQIQINDLNLKIKQSQKTLNDLYENKNELIIYAEETGIVSNFNLKVGDKISTNQNVGNISDTDNSYIEVYFLKEKFEKINLGDEASVFMTKYFSTVTGTVTGKDSTPVQMGGGISGYLVSIKIQNPGGYSVGELAQITVTNSGGTYEGMGNGKIVDVKVEVITSKVSGKIKSVNVDNGQYVNKGDIIASVEGDDIELQIAEQQNIIEKSQSQLNDLMIGDTVYSPMRGTVINIDVSEEEVVDRNAVLMTVADLSNMEVVLAVDELDINKIMLGQQANITSDVFKDEKFTGKVTKISMEGQNQNGVTTYDVTVRLDDRKALMSGMNVDIEILSDNRENVLVVPIDAVNKINGQYMATIKDKEGNNTETKVELGLANKDNVEIVSGLKEGDVIVYTKVQLDTENQFGGARPVMRVGSPASERRQ
ncbi:MAG: efflux RND transporter periplasmic adaptor subunit [Sedimentibacter sp.]